MITLAIDPGPTKCGWAVLDDKTYMFSGMFASTPEAIITFFKLDASELGIHRCLIEKPVVGRRQAAKLIHETGIVTGFICGLGYGMGFRFGHVRAMDWRKQLCGTHTASDKLIKECVEAVVLKLPAKTNEHTRDAMGLALYA